MAFDTFEERAAYIQKCEIEISDAVLRVARGNAVMEQFNATMQAFWTQYSIETTMLIYRGMFDPNFCKPVDAGAIT